MNKKIIFFSGLFLSLEVLSAENCFQKIFKIDSVQNKSNQPSKAPLTLNDQELLKKFAELVVLVNTSQDQYEKEMAQYTLKTEFYGLFVLMCNIVENGKITEAQVQKMSTDSTALYDFLKEELEKI